MKLKIAPLIHARTQDVDFRPGLLVVPEDFDRKNAQWAKKYILESARDFELAGVDGRRVVFCDGKYVVNGLSIRVGDLYRLCGRPAQYERVDGNQINYAFVGIVMHRTELKEVYDIPYPVFLAAYEAYIGLRWKDAAGKSASMKPTKAPYLPQELPKAVSVFPVPADGPKTVLSEGAAMRNSMIAGVLLRMRDGDGLSFCSDMPNAAAITDSGYQIVSARDADVIQQEVEQRMRDGGPRQTDPDEAGCRPLVLPVSRKTGSIDSVSVCLLAASALGAVLALAMALIHGSPVLLGAGAVCAAASAAAALIRAAVRRKGKGSDQGQ